MNDASEKPSSLFRGAVAKAARRTDREADGKHQDADRARGLRADGLPDKRRAGPRISWLPASPERSVVRTTKGWIFDVPERELQNVERWLLGAGEETAEPTDAEVEEDQTTRGIEAELGAILGPDSRQFKAAMRRARGVARKLLWVTKIADKKMRALIDERITGEVLHLHKQGYAVGQIAKKLQISSTAVESRIAAAVAARAAVAAETAPDSEAEPSAPKLDDGEIMRLLAAMAPPPADTAEDHPTAEEHGETLEAADVLPPITN